MNGLTIGKMAQLNQVSVQTLRYYDKIGILVPAYVDNNTSYRYYDVDQSARLDLIIYMKNMGIPLAEIKEQLDKEDLDYVISRFIEHRRCLDAKISEMINMRKAVDTYIQNYSRCKRLPSEICIIKEHIPRRKIFLYKGNENFCSYDYASLDFIVRKFKRMVSMNKIPVKYFCNVGAIIRKEYIHRIEMDEFICSEIFVFVDEEFENSDNIEIIPEGDYLCVYFINILKENDSARVLLKYAMDNGYQISGDYLMEVIADLPIFSDNGRNMFCKIQMPVVCT